MVRFFFGDATLSSSDLHVFFPFSLRTGRGKSNKAALARVKVEARKNERSATVESKPFKPSGSPCVTVRRAWFGSASSQEKKACLCSFSLSPLTPLLGEKICKPGRKASKAICFLAFPFSDLERTV